MRFWGATLARNLPAALEIYADILRRPHLPDDELEPVQALALQDMQGLEDEPRQKVMVELRRRHYPPPLGQDRRGTAEGIEGLTADAIRAPLPPAVPAAAARSCRWPATSTGSRCATRSAGCSATGQGEPPPALTLGPTPDAARPPAEGHGADADRHRLPERAGRPPRLLRRPGGGQRAVRRHELAAVHRGAREARPVLLRLGQLPDVQGPGQRPLLRRHHQRTRPGDARRDAAASCSGCRTASSEEVERACRPG